MRTSIIAVLLAVGCTSGSPPPRAGGDLASATFALSYPAGEGEQEIRRAQASVRRSPGRAESYAALARAFLLRRRESGEARLAAYAEDALIAAEARDRRDPAVRTVAILMLHDQHRFAEARAAARELQGAAPDDPTGHLLEGDAALELGDYRAAAEAVQRALDLVPDLRSYGRAAYLRWLHGDIDGAL
jgi:Flp pilus assembly protein TadD